jgi:cell division septation protein DedD
VKRLLLIVVLCLFAFPLWADYGLSNVVTKEINRENQPPADNAAEAVKQAPSAAPIEKIPPTPPAEFKKIVFYPYTIHISSWQNSKDAVVDYEKKYRKLDVVFITKINLGQNGIWYRIDYGAFPTIKEAVLQMKELQAKNVIDQGAFIGSSVPYAIELGVFTGNEDALAQAQKLRIKGIIPYVMKEPGDVYRLLAGAYPDKKSAEPAREDLKSLGMQPKITKR